MGGKSVYYFDLELGYVGLELIYVGGMGRQAIVNTVLEFVLLQLIGCHLFGDPVEFAGESEFRRSRDAEISWR